jgi:hypothetical protein
LLQLELLLFRPFLLLGAQELFLVVLCGHVVRSARGRQRSINEL